MKGFVVLNYFGRISSNTTMSQSTGRIQVSRSSKITVSIAEVDQSGQFIMLHNTSKTKDFDLSNYVLTRVAPRSKVSKYTFGSYSLPANKKLKILSYNNESDKDDKENEGMDVKVASQKDCKMWGSGSGEVTLDDSEGKRKADFKIVYLTD